IRGKTTCPTCSKRCAELGRTGLRVCLDFSLRGGVAHGRRALPRKQEPSRSLEGDAIAQRLETAHEALLGDNAGDAVEVGSAEVAILFVSTEHFVSGDENAVGNRHGGSFFASTSFQSPEPLLEVAALLARCAEGGLDQSGHEMDVAP